MGWVLHQAPDVVARTHVDFNIYAQTLHGLNLCEVGTSPRAVLEDIFVCMLINSLETTMRGETTEEACSSLSRQQLNRSAAQGNLEALTGVL